jgi:hypothetical protein
MHARYLAIALLLVATAFLPFGAFAHAEGNQPTDEVIITEVATDVDTGITEMQPVTESVGDVMPMVAWQNSSTVRRIQDGFGRLFADDLSQTSIDQNPLTITVSGYIWKNYAGSASYSCGATAYGAKIVNCQTADVTIPADVRGTGGHSFQDGNGTTVMPMTDTGWRFLS